MTFLIHLYTRNLKQSLIKMIRLRVPGKVLIFFITVPIAVLIIYGVFSSVGHVSIPVADPHGQPITPTTPGLAVFGRQEEKLEEGNDMVERSNGKKRSVVQPRREIEIWGKASIAEYLWSHILGGNATTYANGLLAHGEISLEDIHFRYRSGPGIIQNTVPSTVKYLVLVLNGKDSLKIRFARSWLDYLVHLRHLRRAALVMLGSEQCDNEWVRRYLRSQGGPIDVLFLVYDSPLVDNKEVFQWPLGVATYRGFPNFRSDKLNVRSKRKHLCNFFGTVYQNSSRESLLEKLTAAEGTLKGGEGGKRVCQIQTRDTWSPSETFASMDLYLRTVTESDLTLSPVGKNTECYRIYEALALGSVPVVEDLMTPGSCAPFAPLRLLKAHQAPLIYLHSWTELADLLQVEANRSVESKIARRTALVKWYEHFKNQMRTTFLDQIRYHFLKKNKFHMTGIGKT